MQSTHRNATQSIKEPAGVSAAPSPGQGTKQGRSISCWMLLTSWSPQSCTPTGRGGESGRCPPQRTTQDRFRR